jgi:hypothetical protein
MRPTDCGCVRRTSRSSLGIRVLLRLALRVQPRSIGNHEIRNKVLEEALSFPAFLIPNSIFPRDGSIVFLQNFNA